MALADRSARSFSGHAGQVLAVAFAPDGATIATGGVDRTARIWDARTGAELRRLTGPTGLILSIAFAPDGATAASANVCTHKAPAAAMAGVPVPAVRSAVAD